MPSCIVCRTDTSLQINLTPLLDKKLLTDEEEEIVEMCQKCQNLSRDSNSNSLINQCDFCEEYFFDSGYNSCSYCNKLFCDNCGEDDCQECFNWLQTDMVQLLQELNKYKRENEKLKGEIWELKN